MKNAPTQNSGESVDDKRNYTPGVFLSHYNTVLAAVLATLLEGQKMTGMHSVFSHSTTRLSAAIHRLETEYGWRIDRCKVPAKTKDGRQARITVYWLNRQMIAAAFSAGAAVWIDQVKIARAKLQHGTGVASPMLGNRVDMGPKLADSRGLSSLEMVFERGFDADTAVWVEKFKVVRAELVRFEATLSSLCVRYVGMVDRSPESDQTHRPKREQS